MHCLTNGAIIGGQARTTAFIVALAIAPGVLHAQKKAVAQGGPPATVPVTPANDPTPGPVNVIHRSTQGAPERARHARRSYPLSSTGIAAYGYVPVFITGDGRVFADLGFGYEPIVRACTYAAAAQVPQGYAPPSYTPPAMITPTPLNPEDPANKRASDEAAARGASPTPGDSASRAAAPSSCWARDAAGYVFIARQ